MRVPPAFRFQGNRERALQLKAQALQFYNFSVNQFELGGISFASKELPLYDGSLIHIVIKKESIYGHITGVITVYAVPNNIKATSEFLYLESGFLELGTTAKCNESTFLPAILTFTNPIITYTSSTATPLLGKALIDNKNDQLDTPYSGELLLNNSSSKTMGGRGLKTSVTDLCGNTYAGASAIYGDQDMWLQKACQRYVPSSLYSGKLRLFVQALYGSTRRDYLIPLDPFSGLPTPENYKLILGEETFELFEHHMPTTGLFTTLDYQYYLMTCSTSSITFKKLKISATAKGWLAILVTHPLRTDKFFSNRVEAYALSTAKIDTEFDPIVRTLSVSATGIPIGYGFKFNWRGNQAKVVLHELDVDASHLNYSRTVTIDIADDLTVTSSVTSPIGWKNDQSIQLWYPDFLNYRLNSFGQYVGGIMNTANCPLYGYYNHLDVWEPVTISSNVVTSTANQPFSPNPVTSANFPGYGLDPPVGVDRQTYQYTNKLVGTTGFSAGGETKTFPHYQGVTWQKLWDPQILATHVPRTVGSTYNITTHINFPDRDTNEHGYICNYLVTTHPKGPGQWGWYQDVNGWTLGWNSPQPSSPSIRYSLEIQPASNRFYYYGYESISGGYDTTKVMLAVPLNDAEAVIYGISTTKSWTNRGTATNVRHDCILNRVQIALETFNMPSNASSIGTLTETTTINVKQAIVTNFSAMQINGAASTGPGGNNITTIKYAHSGKDSYMYQAIDGEIIKTESTSVASPPAWANTFFEVSQPYPDLSTNYPVIIAQSSVGGASITNLTDIPDKNLNGFPDGLYSAVGWA